MKKLIISLLIIMSAAVFAVSAGAVMTISGEEVTATAGDTMTMDISVSDNPGFMAMNIYYTIDSEHITLAKVTNKISGFTFTHVNTSVWDGAENYMGNGAIATLTLELAEDIPDGTYDIEIVFVDATDYDFGAVEATTVKGTITVETPAPDIQVTGASIRTSTANVPQGLRFLTRVGRTNNDIVIVEEGTLLIPERHLSGELTLDTEDVLVIKKAQNRYYTYAENYYEYTGVLTGIPVNEYGTSIAARAYAKYTVGDDDTVYTAYSNTLVRSVIDVANAVLADNNADAEVKEAIQLIIDEYNAQ